MKKPSKSFEIALSAVACAVGACALTLGCYVRFFLAAGYLIALFANMVPLSKGFWQGALLSHFGAVLLAFLFYGFSIFTLLPYLIFFGLHPIVNYFQKKYLKFPVWHILAFLVKAVWFCLTMWLGWEVVFVELFGLAEASWYAFVEQYFFVVLFVGGIAFFAAYDYAIFLCQRAADVAIKRIGR